MGVIEKSDKLALHRLIEERKKWRSSHPEGFHAKPLVENDSINLLFWKCEVPGKPNSPLQGEKFPIEITFTENYPHRPPKCQFKPPLFHPNICPSGIVNLALLDRGWKPTVTIEEEILANPDMEEIAQADAYASYMENRNKYFDRIKKHS